MFLTCNKISINRDEVLRLLDCRHDSPIYDEVIEAYNDIYKEVSRLICPKGILEISPIPEQLNLPQVKAGAMAAFVIFTLGSKISKYSSKLFEQGDYLKGMLVNSMADSCLFQMEKEWNKTLRDVCCKRKFGVSCRLEAPQDMPMKAQEVIYNLLSAKDIGIEISSGYMFSPVKTTCQIFILSEDETIFNTQHDCNKCKAVNCKLRNNDLINILVTQGKQSYDIKCSKSENLMTALIKNNSAINTYCGGNGICGKCKIQLLYGDIDLTETDKQFFNETELQAGYRLACMAHPKTDCSIKLHFIEENQFEIVSDFVGANVVMSNKSDEYGIAIDIGTTTIAMQLIRKDNKQIAATYTALNPQRAYGADVISRIQASNLGMDKQLKKVICEALEQGIQKLIADYLISKNMINQIVIAANTTMVHLLMGYSCKTLGVSPFKAVNIKTINCSYQDIFNNGLLNCSVKVTPSISTFVGGDIVSGILSCGMAVTEEISLFIDLGTNGEMALGNCNKILATSVAAGPAFEGGNITFGTGSVLGAISNVSLDKENRHIITTIGSQPPVGICGTGIIEAAAELMRTEIIDETGRFEEQYFQGGFKLAESVDGKDIIITQKDIREIQLAKSAVRAGIEVLIKRFGISYEQITHVYLAGGFGYKINFKKAIDIGMFPAELTNKITALGNTSLGGAVHSLFNEKNFESTERIVIISEEVNLSLDKVFQYLYMEFMYFE